MPTEEQQVVNEGIKSQVVLQPSMESSQQISPMNAGSKLPVHPIPVFPTPNPSTSMELNLNQKYEADPMPVSLNLSLSFDPDRSSSYQVMSGFNNGDNMISVN